MAQTELEQYKTYEYDSFNRATKVVVEDYREGRKETHIQKNFYDAENLRYGIEEDGVRTNFVTNGWNVFTELDKDWKVSKRLIRGYGIVASEEFGRYSEREIQKSPNQKISEDYHFYHQNEHGDMEYITGSNGQVRNAYTYDVFGNITNSTELVNNRYTYNGEQYDSTTSQYYLRARYYNPLVGRFTQEDVYRGDGLNLYAYCGNNPVMYVEPSGYDGEQYMSIPEDADFVEPIQAGSWRLTPNGAEAHLIERVNIRGRSDLGCYDKGNTPRFYPNGTPENAGQAHIRLHEAARNAGIKLQ